MTDKMSLGFGMLAAALTLGLLANGLLVEGPWGLNAFLWLMVLVALLVGLARWQKLALLGEGRWFLAAVLVFGAMVAVRDSPVLKAANGIAVLCSLAFVMLRGRAGAMRSLGIVQGLVCLAIAGLNAAFGFVLLLFGYIPWQEVVEKGRAQRLGAIARGLLIAVPLLLVFGGLFCAADAAFQNLILRIFHFNPDALLYHGFIIVGAAWLSGGFLRGALMRDNPDLINVPRPGFLTLGSVEMSVALGALNALFLLFVCVQLPYFFGGQAHVIATAGLTASDYARRGFFELVTVAALVLPLLLAGQGLLKNEDVQAHRLFRSFAGILILLTYIVMASAIQRMALYHIGFGLTELRFYTTAFMAWLAILFLWFALTALRGYREPFFCGAFLSSLAVLAVLNGMNPDAFIVQANVARLEHGRNFDAGYAASLSADAVPALIASWNRLDETHRETLAGAIQEKWLQPRRDDWRTWNLGRVEARTAVLRARASIEAYKPGLPKKVYKKVSFGSIASP